MPCVNSSRIKTGPKSRVVIPHPMFVWDARPAFVTAIITLIDAFRDARKMMRATHRHRPFFDE
jgi:hypothetical protein